MNIDQTKPILVTGASGYIASWIVKFLLDGGHIVHATVRDPAKSSSVAHLLKLAAGASGTLKLFQADLLAQGSFDEAMQGVELVIHTASPFILDGYKDAHEALIRPALEGTQNVLNSVERTPSVKRVVLTSSVAAAYGEAVDLLREPNQTATEDSWNTSSSLAHQPYSYSKTVAEQAAWAANKLQSRWDLVCINPSLVLGPALTTSSASGSIGVLKQCGDGTMAVAAPDLSFGVVDVRDVAQAHISAGFNPSAQGRYLISAQSMSLLQIGQTLRHKYSRYPLPKRVMPKFILMLLAPLVGQTRAFIKHNVGYAVRIDTQKIQRELGVQYRDVQSTLEAHFQQMIDDGLIKKR